MSPVPPDTHNALPVRPPVVDLATWQAAREELLVREKAHTREGDALAAARRRLPMVELDGAVEVAGPDGPVPFLDLFQGRDELVVYQHMWYDGAPHQGQCEGCTTTASHVKDAVYLNTRGVSFTVLTSGLWYEVAPYVEFMGYTQPWYSVRGVEAPVGGGMGHITCFLRDGDRVFLTYSTTGRGNEPVNESLGLLDMTPYGRREAAEDNPEGWPEGREADSPAFYARAGTGARPPTASPPGARPAGPCRSGPAPARPPWRTSAARATTTDAPSSTASAKVLGAERNLRTMRTAYARSLRSIARSGSRFWNRLPRRAENGDDRIQVPEPANHGNGGNAPPSHWRSGCRRWRRPVPPLRHPPLRDARQERPASATRTSRRTGTAGTTSADTTSTSPTILRPTYSTVSLRSRRRRPSRCAASTSTWSG